MSLQQRIVDEALGWVGTPYHHHGRIRGVGVDCAMLLAEVYATSGAIPRLDPGFYAPQYGLHRSDTLFEGWVAQYADRVEGPPQLADVVLFRFGRTFSHGAIAIGGGQIVHAVLRADCVLISRLDEPEYAALERRIYRLRGV